MGTEDFFLEVERPECEAEHSPASSAEFKNGKVIPPLPQRHHDMVLN